MKVKFILAAVAAALLRGGAVLAQEPDKAEEAANRERMETAMTGMDCAAKKDKLLYDYLGAAGPALKNYKFKCAGGKETINMPVWFGPAVSSMAAREMEPGKEKYTEAGLWQAPFGVLYEVSELAKKTLPVGKGGLGLHQRFLVRDYSALAVRYDKALAGLKKAGLAGSFGGRGDAVFAALARAQYDLDALDQNFEVGTPLNFYEKALSILKNAEEAFAALFSEPAASGALTGVFAADYKRHPRLLAGYRAVSLELPVHQLEGVKRGDRADLLVTYENVSTGSVKGLSTATILQNVEILSVTRPPDASAAKGSLRLLVKPIEAQYAALSSVQGKDLTLALRAEGDGEVKPMDVANFRKVIK